MHWDVHSHVTVDAEEFTFSNCGTVWVTRIPLSNREMRDFSKLSTGGLKCTPLLSSTRSVTKSGFLWGLQWEEIRTGMLFETMAHNYIALVLILKCLLDGRGKQRRGRLSHADEGMKHCVLNLPVKTSRTLVYQKWRKCQSWHTRLPKSHNLMLRIGAALQKNCRCFSNQAFSIYNVLLKCTFQKL